MYKNALTKIGDFFKINIQKNPEDIFKTLLSIVTFDTGYIELAKDRKYQYKIKEDGQFCYIEALKIGNAQFGQLTITRNKDFSATEKNILKCCTPIITNLIKDAELNEIKTMQVETLQEGIYKTNEAYELAKTRNDFFAKFSHELRTPLNSIISSSELLTAQIFGSLNEKQLEYIDDIYIASLHLLGMINDILDMSKLEANSMKLSYSVFNLYQNLKEVCNILNPLAVKKQIKITVNSPQNIEINADYGKIQQILFNLINNSIKYTPKNGKIEITLTQTTTKTIVKVKDNGIGIEKKYHKKIFEKYTQIGNNKDSNGLGLTITKELIELHNGKIYLKSQPGIGTEFTLELPI